MNSRSRFTRTLLLALIAMTLAGAGTGCHWLKKKTSYLASKETQPLEIPPGLDTPDTSGSTGLPTVNTASGTGTRSGTDLQVAGSASEIYPKVGAALESIEGVKIDGRAEALGSYDVSYQGESFLIRVQDSNGGSRLVALSADGRILTSGAAATLMSAVKAKLL
jgi:uncharacterized lipoprotein